MAVHPVDGLEAAGHAGELERGIRADRAHPVEARTEDAGRIEPRGVAEAVHQRGIAALCHRREREIGGGFGAVVEREPPVDGLDGSGQTETDGPLVDLACRAAVLRHQRFVDHGGGGRQAVAEGALLDVEIANRVDRRRKPALVLEREPDREGDRHPDQREHRLPRHPPCDGQIPVHADRRDAELGVLLVGEERVRVAARVHDVVRGEAIEPRPGVALDPGADVDGAEVEVGPGLAELDARRQVLEGVAEVEGAEAVGVLGRAAELRPGLEIEAEPRRWTGAELGGPEGLRALTGRIRVRTEDRQPLDPAVRRHASVRTLPLETRGAARDEQGDDREDPTADGAHRRRCLSAPPRAAQ